MKNDISKFASDGYSPGLSGLSGYTPGERNLYITSPYMTGDDVQFVQGIVGVKMDGVFGPQTSAGVKQFQSNNGLMATGYVDAGTWAKLKDTKAKSGPSILPDSLTQTIDNYFDAVKGKTDWLWQSDSQINAGAGDSTPQNTTGDNKIVKYFAWAAVGVTATGILVAVSGNND